ncbi:MAG TPA: hypothetical protein VFZ84_06880 [Burkholderiales bacterium]|jgi:hypothetical protein
MKRFIAAVSFAVLAVPAFAGGLPYDQNLVDRALPNLPEKAVRAETGSAFGAPFDQTLFDRALPSIEPRRTHVAEYKGDTRSDVEIATEEKAPQESAESVWANDYHFIAPAQ